MAAHKNALNYTWRDQAWRLLTLSCKADEWGWYTDERVASKSRLSRGLSPLLTITPKLSMSNVLEPRVPSRIQGLMKCISTSQIITENWQNACQLSFQSCKLKEIFHPIWVGWLHSNRPPSVLSTNGLVLLLHRVDKGEIISSWRRHIA